MALRVFLWPPTSALRQPLQALGAVVAAADSLIALWQATAVWCSPPPPVKQAAPD